jgi:hypothetical protein
MSRSATHESEIAPAGAGTCTARAIEEMGRFVELFRIGCDADRCSLVGDAAAAVAKRQGLASGAAETAKFGIEMANLMCGLAPDKCAIAEDSVEAVPRGT